MAKLGLGGLLGKPLGRAAALWASRSQQLLPAVQLSPLPQPRRFLFAGGAADDDGAFFALRPSAVFESVDYHGLISSSAVYNMPLLDRQLELLRLKASGSPIPDPDTIDALAVRPLCVELYSAECVMFVKETLDAAALVLIMLDWGMVSFGSARRLVAAVASRAERWYNPNELSSLLRIATVAQSEPSSSLARILCDATLERLCRMDAWERAAWHPNSINSALEATLAIASGLPATEPRPEQFSSLAALAADVLCERMRAGRERSSAARQAFSLSLGEAEVLAENGISGSGSGRAVTSAGLSDTNYAQFSQRVSQRVADRQRSEGAAARLLQEEEQQEQERSLVEGAAARAADAELDSASAGLAGFDTVQQMLAEGAEARRAARGAGGAVAGDDASAPRPSGPTVALSVAPTPSHGAPAAAALSHAVVAASDAPYDAPLLLSRAAVGRALAGVPEKQRAGALVPRLARIARAAVSLAALGVPPSHPFWESAAHVAAAAAASAASGGERQAGAALRVGEAATPQFVEKVVSVEVVANMAWALATVSRLDPGGKSGALSPGAMRSVFGSLGVALASAAGKGQLRSAGSESLVRCLWAYAVTGHWGLAARAMTHTVRELTRRLETAAADRAEEGPGGPGGAGKGGSPSGQGFPGGSGHRMGAVVRVVNGIEFSEEGRGGGSGAVGPAPPLQPLSRRSRSGRVSAGTEPRPTPSLSLRAAARVSWCIGTMGLGALPPSAVRPFFAAVQGAVRAAADEAAASAGAALSGAGSLSSSSSSPLTMLMSPMALANVPLELDPFQGVLGPGGRDPPPSSPAAQPQVAAPSPQPPHYLLESPHIVMLAWGAARARAGVLDLCTQLADGVAAATLLTEAAAAGGASSGRGGNSEAAAPLLLPPLHRWRSSEVSAFVAALATAGAPHSRLCDALVGTCNPSWWLRRREDAGGSDASPHAQGAGGLLVPSRHLALVAGGLAPHWSTGPCPSVPGEEAGAVLVTAPSLGSFGDPGMQGTNGPLPAVTVILHRDIAALLQALAVTGQFSAHPRWVARLIARFNRALGAYAGAPVPGEEGGTGAGGAAGSTSAVSPQPPQRRRRVDSLFPAPSLLALHTAAMALNMHNGVLHSVAGRRRAAGAAPPPPGDADLEAGVPLQGPAAGRYNLPLINRLWAPLESAAFSAAMQQHHPVGHEPRGEPSAAGRGRYCDDEWTEDWNHGDRARAGTGATLDGLGDDASSPHSQGPRAAGSRPSSATAADGGAGAGGSPALEFHAQLRAALVELCARLRLPAPVFGGRSRKGLLLDAQLRLPLGVPAAAAAAAAPSDPVNDDATRATAAAQDIDSSSVDGTGVIQLAVAFEGPFHFLPPRIPLHAVAPAAPVPGQQPRSSGGKPHPAPLEYTPVVRTQYALLAHTGWRVAHITWRDWASRSGPQQRTALMLRAMRGAVGATEWDGIVKQAATTAASEPQAAFPSVGLQTEGAGERASTWSPPVLPPALAGAQRPRVGSAAAL